MSFIIVSLIVFVCVFGGAMLGMRLHSVLPNHHLTSESKDIVKLGMGMVGTMSALVLGLLVASAKGSYEAQRAELTQMSANVAVLDRILANYGPETKEARAVLRDAVARVLDECGPTKTPALRVLRPLPPALKSSTRKSADSHHRTRHNAHCTAMPCASR